MRPVPPGLSAHLASPATTLCRCWRLNRRDGTVLGFTDHDRDLLFDGTTFRAGTGLDGAEAAAELGFAVGGGEVAGALGGDAVAEDDIAAGLYDGATVETWLVNWTAPADRLQVGLAEIGEIRRRDGAFVAELRGAAHRLDEERGRLFRATCGADLGDARCRVALDTAAFRGVGTVRTTDGAVSVAAEGLDAFADGWFTAGRLRWTTGANVGGAVEVAIHRTVADRVTLDLWQRAPRPVAPGDRFVVTAGCDKRLATCAGRFANVANFRGFPHMPGTDFVVAVAASGTARFDGGSLFR